MTDSSQPFGDRRRIATFTARQVGRGYWFCAAVGIGLACFGVGAAVVWTRLVAERSYQNGLTAISTGDIEVMSQALQRLPTDSPRAKLLLAAIHLRIDKPEVALRELQGAANDPKTALQAHFLAGEALCRMQDYHAAITTLRGALERDPDNVNGHRWLGVAAYDLGATADAVEQMRHVLRLDSQDPRAYRMLGLIYYEAEEFPQAIAAYQASLSCSREQPDIEQILAELAVALLRVNRYEDVLSTLKGAPATPDLGSLRAEALYALGSGQEAQQIVETVLHSDQSSRALILQGLILLDAGRAAEAIAPLERAVEMTPEDFETRAKLTQAYSQAGNIIAARRELAEFERIKTVRQEIHKLTLKAAQQPEAADVRFELGLRYQQLGLTGPARKWFRAALALDPAHATARKALVELLEITATSGRN